MGNRFQGVIFDMDGVLCDSEPFIRAAACQMFAESHNLRVRPEEFAPFTGAGDDRFVGGVGQKHGVQVVLPRDKVRTYQIYLQMIRGKLLPLPGAAAFLEQCRQRGLRLALASSADRLKVEGNLNQIGLPAQRFHAVVTGSEVKSKKPDPEAFLLAAVKLGLPAERCLVVEDAPHGIDAARRAGAACLALTTTFPAEALRPHQPQWIAADLGHVPAEVLEG